MSEALEKNTDSPNVADDSATGSGAGDSAAPEQIQETESSEKAEGGGAASEILTSKGDDEKVTHVVDFPEDWIEKIAGDDEKVARILSRFKNPYEAIKSGLAAQEKIREGVHKRFEKPGDDAPDEDKKLWRESMDIPDSPDGYEYDFDPGEEMKADLEALSEISHRYDLSKEQANAIAKEYFDAMERSIGERNRMDSEVAEQTRRALIGELGADYKANIEHGISVLKNLVGEEVAESILSARTDGGEGHILAADYDFNKMLMEVADVIAPEVKIVPNSSTPMEDAVEEFNQLRKELIENRNFMKDSAKVERYNKLAEIVNR
ncbi:MAG: hypothetical protein CUN56_00550 [Phototrophicales bacterium]|nr:MAG: hypothetical protein CUN56_00550 [Phototrophicales bacterium]